MHCPLRLNRTKGRLFVKSDEERPFFTSRKESKRYIAESLSLQDAMVIDVVPPQGERGRFFEKVGSKTLSLIWLDVSKRPELRDLARVHATEGDGESIFTWVYIDEDKENCYFVLNVRMQKTSSGNVQIRYSHARMGAACRSYIKDRFSVDSCWPTCSLA